MQKEAATMTAVFHGEPLAQADRATLRYAVRMGTHPNRPERISAWILAENRNTTDAVNSTWHAAKAQFELLLETFCDHLVRTHWRWVCLDHINRPLVMLMQLADTPVKKDEVRKMYEALRVISHHFH